MLIAIDAKRIDNALSFLRNSAFPAKEYGRLADFAKAAYFSFFSFPNELLPWRATAARFRFELTFGWGVILTLCIFLLAQGVPSPDYLGGLTPADLQPLIHTCPAAQLLRSFWSVARSNRSEGSSGDIFIPDHASFTQASQIKDAQAHISQYSRTGAISLRTSNKQTFRSSFAMMGPAQRTKHLGSAQILPRLVGRFAIDSTRVSLLNQVRGSSPGMLSAFRRYADFCQLRNHHAFPVLDEIILQRSVVFNNTATYGGDISPYWGSAAFVFVRQPPGSPPCVRHVAKGLKKAQEKRFRLPNFIRIHLMVRIIDHVSAHGEFAQAAFFSFLPLFI